MPPVTGLNHVSITVADAGEALRFWQGLLGLEVGASGEMRHPHLDEIVGFHPTRVRFAELAIPGGGMLELFEYVQPRGVAQRDRTCDPGSMHLCVEVEGLDALVEALREAGYSSRSARPATVPDEDRFGDWAGYRSIYVLGPDGVTVELVEPPAR